MKWEFKKYEKEDTRFNSSSSKFFGDLTPQESLVREFVQNSLDAGFPGNGEPVKIIIKEHIVSKKDIQNYIADLEEHLVACKLHAHKNKECRILTLEDFNTRGLDGNNKDDFFYNDNRNHKESGGGSHGIGKAVFNNSSKIKTFFAYSLFKGSAKIRSIFQGRCVIDTHTIGKKEFYPYGNGKMFENDVSNSDFIDKFFSRNNGKTGLSVAIPYCEIKINDIKESFIKQCYMPIFNEKLVVEIEDKRIDKNALLDSDNPIVKMLLDHETSSPDLIERHIPEKTWKSESGDGVSKLKEDIRKKVENQSSLFSIKLELDLPKMKKGTRKQERGVIEIKVERREDDQSGELDVWRSDVLVSEACGKKASHKGFSTLVLIEGENNPMGGILRKLEDPGHRKWPFSTLPDEVKKNYKAEDIRHLVRFVKKLPQMIIESIRIPPSNLDSGFFSDYFPDISQGSEQKGGGSKERGNTPPEIPHFNQDFNYRSIIGGFSLVLTDKENFQEKNAIVKVAYGITEGNPFKKYRKEDFIFKKNIDIKIRGGRGINCFENEIRFSVKKPTFQINFKGFDPDRELKVEVISEKNK